MISKIRSFLNDTRAAVAFEAVIITPILAWCFVGSFIFFDAFRTYSSSLKATYAIADVLSREDRTIYANDIQGLSDIFEHITRNPSGGSMRVSQVAWDADTNTHSVDWSSPTNGRTRLRDTDLPGIVDQIPIMADAERVIIVETFVPYRPYFNIGLDPIEFTNFTITRPRFGGQLAWDPTNNPSCSSCNGGEEVSLNSSDAYTPAYDEGIDDTSDGS